MIRRPGTATGSSSGGATLLAAAVPTLLLAIVVLLALDALPALQRFGSTFFSERRWDPVSEQFGAAAYVYGTVVTSLLALLLATPVAVGCALFIAEYAPLRLLGDSSTRISPSLFTPGYTLASAIANQFTEADKAIYFSAIVACALVLLLVAAVMNVLARLLVWSVSHGPGAAAIRAG